MAISSSLFVPGTNKNRCCKTPPLKDKSTINQHVLPFLMTTVHHPYDCVWPNDRITHHIMFLTGMPTVIAFNANSFYFDAGGVMLWHLCNFLRDPRNLDIKK